MSTVSKSHNDYYYALIWSHKFSIFIIKRRLIKLTVSKMTLINNIVQLQYFYLYWNICLGNVVVSIHQIRFHLVAANKITIVHARMRLIIKMHVIHTLQCCMPMENHCETICLCDRSQSKRFAAKKYNSLFGWCLFIASIYEIEYHLHCIHGDFL